MTPREREIQTLQRQLVDLQHRIANPNRLERAPLLRHERDLQRKIALMGQMSDRQYAFYVGDLTTA
jgi:hypothetical protein